MNKKMNETWVGRKAYSGKRIYTDDFIQEHPEFHAITHSWPFNKKKVALDIGLLMIADGCVKVESWFDIDTMHHTYAFVARPFTKEKRLP